MFGNKSLFLDLDESFRNNVKLENKFSIDVKRQDTIRLRVKGRAFRILGVFYVPDLKRNLLNIGQLQEKGLLNNFLEGLLLNTTSR